MELLDSAESELLFVYPTARSFLRGDDEGILSSLENIVLERGVKARILSPADRTISERINGRQGWQFIPYDAVIESIETRSETPAAILFREIEPASNDSLVEIVIADRVKSLVLELKGDSERDEVAFSLGTFSDRKASVSTFLSFFEKIWRESEIRQSESVARKELVAALAREESARKEAQLLQDILAHDVRNYNQIVQLNAEMLLDSYGAEEQARSQEVFAKDILSAVKQSTELLDKAKKLGRVISDETRASIAVNLMQTIENAMNIVRTANPGKRIIDERIVNVFPRSRGSKGDGAFGHNEICVLADEFLDDVFVNVFANSVKYTSGGEIYVRTLVEDSQKYWTISISDKGMGIPDELKRQVFTRYLKNAKGGGLGMSIVHALVTGRYGGRVEAKNRVDGDYSQGTTIEISLPKAPFQGAT